MIYNLNGYCSSIALSWKARNCIPNIMYQAKCILIMQNKMDYCNWRNVKSFIAYQLLYIPYQRIYRCIQVVSKL